jgi:hypothetical protein
MQMKSPIYEENLVINKTLFTLGDSWHNDVFFGQGVQRPLARSG